MRVTSMNLAAEFLSDQAYKRVAKLHEVLNLKQKGIDFMMEGIPERLLQ